MAGYDGDIIELPAGKAGMVRYENRLIFTPEELLDANGVVYNGVMLRKEPGAAKLDTIGLLGAPTITMTLGASSPWGFTGANVDAANATVPAFVQAFGNQDKSSATPFNSITTLASAPTTAGDLLVIVCAWESPVPPTGTFSFHCTDSKGNAWRQIGITTNPNTLSSVVMFAVLSTVALSLFDPITITCTGRTWTQATTATAEYSGLVTDGFAPASNAAAQGTSTSPSVTTPSISQLPQFVIGAGGTSSVTAVAANAPAVLDSSNISSNTVWIAHQTYTTSTTIIALWDWWPQSQPAVLGTVSTVAGSTTVTGAGTNFLSTTWSRDFILLHAGTNPELRQVATVTSNTTLTVTEPVSQTLGGGTYVVTAGPRLITAALDGKLYKEQSQDGSFDIDAFVLKMGLSTTARPGWFTQGGAEAGTTGTTKRKLFYFNGVNKPQVLSNDAFVTTDIATPPADWSGTNQPIAGTVHEQRLVAWGNRSDPHKLYFSDPTNHENFTSAAAKQFRVYSNIGDRVYCAVEYQGVLHVWKWPVGIFYLDDSDLDPTNWAIRVKSERLGCAPSPYAALQMDDDVLFITPNGSFHLLSAVDSLGGTRASDLSYALGLRKFLSENINLKKLDQVTSLWYPDKKLAMFGVPGTGQNTNTLLLKFDFAGVQRGGPVRFSYSQRDSADALATRRDENFVPRPILGEAGFVWLLDQNSDSVNSLNKGGQAYQGLYQTPLLDFSHKSPGYSRVRKQFDHLEIVFNPVTAGTLRVRVFVDGGLRQTLDYDATKRRVKHKLSAGDGYTISVEGSNSALDEDFQVLQHNFYVKPGREDTSRTQASDGGP